MYSTRAPRDVWDHPKATKEEVQRCIDAVKRGVIPSLTEEAQRLVDRFYEAVRRNPCAFVNGRLYGAICCLERAVAKRGAKLECLGLSKKKVLHEARKILAPQ